MFVALETTPDHTRWETRVINVPRRSRRTSEQSIQQDHFTRCKQHWSRSTSCFSFL